MPIGDDLGLSSNYLKASQLDGDGMILKVVKKAELIDANNPKFGFPPGTQYAGKTIRYFFDKGTLDSTSKRLLGALNASGVEPGEYVRLSRMPAGTDTQYFAEKMDQLTDAHKAGDVPSPPKEDISIDDINF